MKIIVSDFDNTLFFPDYSPYQIEDQINAIKNWQEQGNLFIINTGRSFTSIKKVLTYYNFPFNYLICGNGSTIYDQDYNLLFKKELSQESIIEINNILTTFNPKNIIYYSNDKLENTLFDHSVTNIFQPFSNYDQALQINNRLNSLNNVDSYLSTSYININHSDVNKSIAINNLLSLINLTPKKIYTIGDSFNDLVMIKDYHGYQIGNNEVLDNIAVKSFEDIKSFIEEIKNEV